MQDTKSFKFYTSQPLLIDELPCPPTCSTGKPCAGMASIQCEYIPCFFLPFISRMCSILFAVIITYQGGLPRTATTTTTASSAWHSLHQRVATILHCIRLVTVGRVVRLVGSFRWSLSTTERDRLIILTRASYTVQRPYDTLT